MELTTEKKATKTKNTTRNIPKKTLEKAYRLMQTAYNMAVLYDENRTVCSKYVHSTSRGMRLYNWLQHSNYSLMILQLLITEMTQFCLELVSNRMN